jgi:hypothetical protein
VPWPAPITSLSYTPSGPPRPRPPASSYRDLFTASLPPGYRRDPGHQARWLWRTLRAAELAGLDAGQVLAAPIAERDLAGARDLAAVVMADRADWDAATRAQRHLAVAADAELHRRHPGRRYPPLRSAEPPPVTQAQRDELTLTAGVRMLSGRVRMRGARDGCAEPGA